MTSGTMLESGINSVAAALVGRKLAGLGLELGYRITGEVMNHKIEIWLPDGRSWLIENARQWFECQTKLRGIAYASSDRAEADQPAVNGNRH